MVSILLIQKISQLFLIMFLGFFAVRLGLVKSEDSAILSKLSLYLIVPCIILTSFQVDFTPKVRGGLILSIIAAAVIMLILIIIGSISKKLFKLDPMEHASVIYSNSGNLILPLVISILGPEWVIYSTGFVAVQMVLLWTHCCSIFAGPESMQFKKIICNVNIITIIIGFFMLITGIHLPEIINEPLTSVGNMIGPVAMLINGMLMSRLKFKEIFLSGRNYLVLLLRMIAGPVIILVLLRLCPEGILTPDSRQVLFISLLAAAAPVASTVTQFAQLYEQSPERSSAINALTTLSCIITMPLFTYFYFL